VAHVERMLGFAGLSDAPTRARRIFELETKIAAGHWNNVDSRDSEKTYNLKPWARPQNSSVTCRSRCGTTHWNRPWALSTKSCFASRASPAPSVRSSRSPTSRLEGLVVVADRGGRRAVLSTEFVDEHFDFYGRTLTGAESIRPRWKRAVALVEGAMGEATGKIYVNVTIRPK